MNFWPPKIYSQFIYQNWIPKNHILNLHFLSLYHFLIVFFWGIWSQNLPGSFPFPSTLHPESGANECPYRSSILACWVVRFHWLPIDHSTHYRRSLHSIMNSEGAFQSHPICKFPICLMRISCKTLEHNIANYSHVPHCHDILTTKKGHNFCGHNWRKKYELSQKSQYPNLLFIFYFYNHFVAFFKGFKNYSSLGSI